MRRLGSALMALGAFVGVATGLAVLANVDVPGVGSWLVAVAVAKLGFIAAFALIAVGAIVRRMADRHGRETDAERVAATLAPLEPEREPLPPGVPPEEVIRPREGIPTGRRPER